MPAEVFLSYARRASRAPVEGLYAALTAAGVSAFLDRRDLPYGAEIPQELADAILGARVVVAFLEPVFFTRPYCRLELRLATALFEHDPAGAGRHVVLALPDDPTAATPLEADLDELPPLLRRVAWPAASATHALVRLIRERLAVVGTPLGDAVDRVIGRGAARAILTGPAALPPPLRLGQPTYVPEGMRGSLRQEFVGRDRDLWLLHQELAPAEQRRGHAALTAALHGMGGVGKTQLAVEYFYRYGPRHYTGGLFWLDAKRDAAEQHHAILRAVGVEQREIEAVREAVGADRLAAAFAGRLAAWLRQLPAERPVLLVIDDVPDPPPPEREGVAPPRPPPLDVWCPAPDAAACLATARAVVAFRGGTALARQTVGVLDPEAALTLLTGGVHDANALAAAEWGEVAEWVGRLPLALRVLNRALRPEAQALRPREALDAARAGTGVAWRIDRAKADLEALSADETLRGTTEAFRLSFRGLPPRAQEAARALACLGPEPIPRALADALGPACADRATQALLLTRSFVASPDVDAQGSSGGAGWPATPSVSTPEGVEMYGAMHRVLADAVRSYSPDLAADLRAVVAALATVITPGRARTPASWPLLLACAPHAAAALALADAQGAHAVGPDGSPSVNLRLALVRLARARGDFAAARGPAGAAHALAERLLGPEHRDTLASILLLAAIDAALGDYRGARRLQERVVEACTRLLGPEHPDALTSLGNLAATLHAQGDYAAARTLEERVAEARERLLGPEHPATLESLNNLAATLKAQGDHTRARALQQQVAEVSERVLGTGHPDTLRSLDSLATMLHAQGDYVAARALEQRVAEARAQLLGPEHPDTLRSLNNLAVTLAAQGELAAACALEAWVVAARERLLGPEHPDTLLSLNNLAEALAAQGDYVAARALEQRVAEARARLLGPEHPATLESLNNLAVTLAAQGELAAARALEERVAEAHGRLLGPEHPATLSTLANLASTLHVQGDVAGARALRERVLVAYTHLLGPEHPATRHAAEKLAVTRGDGGDLVGARAHARDRTGARLLLDRVAGALRRVRGPKHPGASG